MSTKTVLLFTSLIISTQAWGQTHFVTKDNLDTYTGRAYKEGSTAYLKLNIAHACTNEARTEYYPTRSVSVVFPNAIDLSGLAFTTNDDEVTFGGNAIMAIKPRVTRAFRKIKILKADVPEFYNHGAQNRDVRALQWTRGWIENEKYEILEFRASLPKLEGCVKKLRVYTPTVQHCVGGHTLAWLRTPTARFGDAVIASDFAPYFDVIRDEENNPVPVDALCSEAEATLEAYPSDNDIDTYLPLHTSTPPIDDNDNGDTPPVDDNDNGGTPPVDDNDNGGTPPVDDNDNGGTPPVDDNDNDGTPPVDDNDNGGTLPIDDNDNASTRPVDDNDNGDIIDLSNDTDNNDDGLALPPST